MTGNQTDINNVQTFFASKGVFTSKIAFTTTIFPILGSLGGGFNAFVHSFNSANRLLYTGFGFAFGGLLGSVLSIIIAARIIKKEPSLAGNKIAKHISAGLIFVAWLVFATTIGGLVGFLLNEETVYTFSNLLSTVGLGLGIGGLVGIATGVPFMIAYAVRNDAVYIGE